jgi:spoIIIJ-associated protein
MAEAPDNGGIEAAGRTVEEAIGKGLGELGLKRDEVEVTVLSEGRPGILGVGAQPARVSLAPRPRPATPAREVARPFEAAPPVSALDDSFVNQGVGVPARTLDLDMDLVTESAVDVLETLLQLLGFDAEVAAREPVTPGDGAGMIAAVLDVTGLNDDEQGLLIGRRGETLSALQYILNLIVNHQTRSHSLFGVDVEGYRRRRETALGDLARRIADRVRQNGQAMTLEPMPPAERRIVHIALADDPDVETISIGEGDARKVAITPKK